MVITQKITPNLWFDHQAEEAARFYTSIFDDSEIGRITHYGEEGYDIHGMQAGTVLTVAFRLAGQDFLALNGGPHFKFNEAISFIINCETQAEVDTYWEVLTEGGDPDAQQCGWLKDKYGVSWQVVPTVIDVMLSDPDPEKRERVMAAFLQMKKLDIAAIERAYRGDSLLGNLSV